ncbi:MAG: DUF177 domain-containing protein [Thermodesulfobacteriota bacterium]
MKINIEDIPEDGLVLDLREDGRIVEDKRYGSGFSISSPIKAHLDIRKSGENIDIVGHIEAEMVLKCSRCLKEYVYGVHRKIEIAVQTDFNQTTGDRELMENELDVGYIQGGEIDTTDIILEQLFLEVPIQPLCNPDCKGLCPSCGVELKDGQCSCLSKEVVDPRFAILKNFKVKNSKWTAFD